MLDVAHNTGRNTSRLSIVPGRREEDTTLDVARNMLAPDENVPNIRALARPKGSWS
jgi:hypothetical protein